MIVFSILYLIISIVFNPKIALGINLVLSNFAILFIFIFIKKRLKYLSYILSETRKIIDEDLENKIHIKGNGYFSTLARTINDISTLATDCINDNLKSEVLKSKFAREVSISNNIYIEEIKMVMDRVKREVDIDIKDIQIEKINLVEILAELTKINKDNFENNNIEIKKTYKNTSIMINASKLLLKEALKEIFTNIHKHAMQNTKAYIDIVEKDEKIYLSIKNISKDDCNIVDIRSDELSGVRLYENLLAIQKLKSDVENEAGLFKVTIIFNKK